MMKFLEIRDRGTFIPALAFNMEPHNDMDRYLAARAGFGRSIEQQKEHIFLMHLQNGECQYDEYEWRGGWSTMAAAHDWIKKNWDNIYSGQLIDIEFIRGITKEPKLSERDTTQ